MQAGNLKPAETVAGDLKIKIFANLAGKRFVLESLFNEVGVLKTCDFIKKGSDTGVFLSNSQTF